MYCLLLEIIIRTMSKKCSQLNTVALQNQESLEKANTVSSALPPLSNETMNWNIELILFLFPSKLSSSF